ncbi:MAG: DUF6783 domain-containing protein [Ruminococcus sp.]
MFSCSGYTAKWGVQIAGKIFQTRSTGYLTLHFKILSYTMMHLDCLLDFLRVCP